MSIEIATWNLRDGFSDPNRMDGIVQTLIDAHPTVAILPEAYREGHESHLPAITELFSQAGYTAIHGLYNDHDGRLDRHGIMGVVKTESLRGDPQIIKTLGRSALHIPIKDSDSGATMDVYGVHLDDRREETRQAYASGLLKLMRRSSADISVAGGDFNAMHRKSWRSRILRALRPIAKRLPTIEPRPDFKYPKLKRLGSLVSRLTGMANGGTMQKFTTAGFRDTHPNQPATIGSFNLDHIVFKGNVTAVGNPVQKTNKSDHRLLTASFIAK